jgi:Transposase DDE domain group 1
LSVQRDGRRFTVDVVPDGDGLVSHAGAGLLAEAADRLWLTGALSRALAPMRERRGRHDPGRVVRDLAVMLAGGGDCRADLRAVRDQERLFGPVASDATAFRVIDAIASDPALLQELRAARARARGNAWDAGAGPERIVIDIDATLITAHSEKDGRRGRSSAGSSFTRCWRSWTSRARQWPVCPGRATPAPTPPQTTSTCSSWRSSNSPATSIHRGQAKQQRVARGDCPSMKHPLAWNAVAGV